MQAKLTPGALGTVTADTAAFTLLLPGTAGVSLHTKGTDPAVREKLELEAERVAVLLQMEGIDTGSACAIW